MEVSHILAIIGIVLFFIGIIVLCIKEEKKIENNRIREQKEHEQRKERIRIYNEGRKKRLGGIIVDNTHYTHEEWLAHIKSREIEKIEREKRQRERSQGQYINGQYYTAEQIAQVEEKMNEDEFEKFLVSGLVGFVTGSSVIGFLAGGSITGGLLGDFFEGTEDSIF